MNRQELAAWVQTQKDNVTALYKPDTVKSVELFYDKAYVPTDGASNLPEPQLPPGVEPDNSKDLGGAIYPAANPQDAGRIAYNLLQDQPFGNFVLVLRDRNTGQYWVSGPYPGDTTNAEAMARFPANFQRMSTPERPRLTLPEPMRSPTGRPAGSLNARFYPADNGRDAINMARLSYFNYAGNEEPYYMILQSSITDEYYMDGPFLPSDITASELAATYPSYLRVISTLFPN
jgi:hypothetical protein